MIIKSFLSLSNFGYIIYKNFIWSVLIFVLHFMHICWCFYVFTGEVNSRVQAHIDGDEFSAHILTDKTEYNVEVTISTLFYFLQKCVSMFLFLFSLSCFTLFYLCYYLHPPLTTWHLFSLPFQPLWRFTDSQIDSRLLVYRSEDIMNLSRLASPKVCGYIQAEARDLLPEAAKGDWDRQQAMDQENGECSLCSFTGGYNIQNVYGVIVMHM